MNKNVVHFEQGIFIFIKTLKIMYILTIFSSIHY